jgi:hypothetical protein
MAQEGTGMNPTKSEATRNFLWRTAASILGALAYRNMSTERMEVVLGWPTRKLTSFLASAVYDNVSDSDMLTLKDLAHLMHALDMEIKFDMVRMPTELVEEPEAET